MAQTIQHNRFGSNPYRLHDHGFHIHISNHQKHVVLHPEYTLTQVDMD